jgi:hypothetical protein
MHSRRLHHRREGEQNEGMVAGDRKVLCCAYEVSESTKCESRTLRISDKLSEDAEAVASRVMRGLWITLSH